MYKKKVFIGVLVLVAGSILYLLLVHKESLGQEAQHVDIGEMITLFQENEQLAIATYTEKLVEVEGVVEKVSFLNNRHTILLKGDTFTQNFILCDMAADEDNPTQKVVKGDTLKLRGVCKGFLLDVILLNCTRIDEAKN